MTEAERRAAVIAEAMTWIGTPWHHGARVKGAGVDCAQFLIGVYSAAGLIEEFRPEHYPIDWHLNRGEERFLAHLLRYCVPTDDPKPGDVAMFRLGRATAHGAILISPTSIIHAYHDERKVTTSDLPHSPLESRLAGFYRWKGF